MAKYLFTCLWLLGSLLLAGSSAQAQLIPNLGGTRVGISALTFLKNDLSPRSVGMSGATVTQKGDAYSANINPALVSEVRQFSVGLSNLSYGGGIQHSAISVLVPDNNVGTFYASGNLLNLANEKVRTEFAPQGTGETFAAYSASGAVGYSRALSSMFSVGVSAKYLYEQLAQYHAGAIAADVGFLYRTDWRNLRFGAALQHFGANATLRGNYSPDLFQNSQGVATEGYPAPTLFKMGASLDALRREEHVLTAHIQLNHPNDNAENIRLGLEYGWANILYLRAGAKLNVANERVPTGGLGFHYRLGGYDLQADYAVSPSRFLGLYHSLGITFSMARRDGAKDAPAPTPAP